MKTARSINSFKRHQILRWCEFFTLSLFVPVLFFFLIEVTEFFLFLIFPLLWIFAFLCRVILISDSAFDHSSLWRISAVRREGKAIFIRLLPGAILLWGLVGYLYPEQLFHLIRQKPLLWLLILFLYPALSVYPQEIIYRTYFFHRYRTLFPHQGARVVVNALAFGFLHIIFHNWIAVVLSTGGGFLFACTYLRSQSTFLVCLEHAIYGGLIFTIGLGRFFYLGGIELLPSHLRF